MKFRIVENSQNQVSQPVWGNWINNGYWSSPSSVEQWIEENPKFNLFLQYYGVREEFIEICKCGLYYNGLYGKFIDKSEILNKMFIFLNNIKNDNKQTPLYCACEKNNLKMVKLLLDNGAKESINVRDKWNETPLYWACFNDNLEMVKILLDNEAKKSINVKDNWKQTPLFWACENDNLEIVKILLDNGAKKSINIKDDDNQTPLSLAKKHKNKEMIELLEKYNK